jgi:hypothetical protein
MPPRSLNVEVCQSSPAYTPPARDGLGSGPRPRVRANATPNSDTASGLQAVNITCLRWGVSEPLRQAGIQQVSTNVLLHVH